MQAVGSANSLPLALMISANTMPGRVEMPVPRHEAIYAHFEHVSGVASAEGRSFSVDKLKMLNTLIDRLVSLKENPLAARENAGRISSEQIDALLEQYGREAHAAAARTGPYVPSLGLPPGSLISLAA